MITARQFACVAAITTAALNAATTATVAPAIGVATSQGSILIDSARTAGNSTVFSGNTLQTGSSASQVHLKDGAQLRLDTASRARIYTDHADLQAGSARVSGYAASANGLSVRTEGTGSANVSIHGKVVEVSALTGNVHVFNAAGINIANLLPGRALNLVPADAGASAVSSLSGCVTNSGKAGLFLTDETSNITVQLRGDKLPAAGRRAQISGAIVPNATAGSAQVLNIMAAADRGTCGGKLTAAVGSGGGVAGSGRAIAGSTTAGTVAGLGTAAGAASAGSATTAAGAATATAAAAAGISTTTAVVAGVAAAATVGTATGIAAANGGVGQGSGGLGAVGGVPVCTSPCTF